MRSRGSGLALVASVCMFAACPPPLVSSTPADSASASDPEPELAHPLEPATPANQGQGDALDLLIPRVEGGALALSSLAGQAYLLTLGEPDAQREAWVNGVALFEQLQTTRPELGLVMVASSPDPAALDAWLVPWELGWDPQGALGAKLEIAGLPTTFVVDAGGTIIAVVRGMDAKAQQEIEAALAGL